MRTLKNQNIPQDGDNLKFPDGQIQNETINQDGTPVVREVYGDTLTNIYKILRDAGIEPNELEDSENTEYQLLKALKVFANEINDIDQIVTVSGNDLTVNFNVDNLPNGYLFFGSFADNVSAGSYNLNTTKSLELLENVEANKKVLFIVRTSQVQIYDFSKKDELDGIVSPFNSVLSFNSSNKLYYLNDGYITTNEQISKDVGNQIDVFKSDNNHFIVDAVFQKNHLVCLVFNDQSKNYSLFVFNNDFSLLYELTFSSNQISGNDFRPYIYADNNFIYLTNDGNSTNSDNSITKFEIDFTAQTLSEVSTISLTSQFEKTTNVIILNDEFYTFIDSNVYKYDQSGGRTFVKFIKEVNGQIFIFNSKLYIKTGEISIPWQV